MSERNIVIVGASSGIGLCASETLINQGQVYNLSRTESPDDEVISLAMDVTDKYQIVKAFDAVRKVDVLIYCAGYSMAAPVEYVKTKDYRYLYDVNILGFIECAKQALKRMDRGGKIIAVASMGGVSPITFDAFYSSSKAAVIMFIRALNNELKPYGISAHAILPNGVRTRFSFKRKIYPYDDIGVYAKRLSCSAHALIRAEQNGQRCSAIAKSIEKTVNSDKPPIIIVPGIKTKCLYALNKVLPTAVADFFAAGRYC